MSPRVMRSKTSNPLAGCSKAYSPALSDLRPFTVRQKRNAVSLRMTPAFLRSAAMRGHAVHRLGAFFNAQFRFPQHPIGFRRGEPFIPQVYGQFEFLP